MEFGNDTPIIIQKKKKGHGGHHGGAWKVAYADFVTAMMALFIVLWVLSQNDEVKQAVAGYFQDPIGFGSAKGKGVLEMKGESIIDLDLKAQIEQKEREKQKLAQMGENIIGELSESADFHDLMDQIQISIVEEGLKIEILESANDVFFNVGSAQLNKKAFLLMEKIGTQLGKLNNFIAIEGHTDARPFSGSQNGYTNYELSADRANSARKALINGGLRVGQIDGITGFADRRLKDKKNPYDVKNRRISILVKYSG